MYIYIYIYTYTCRSLILGTGIATSSYGFLFEKTVNDTPSRSMFVEGRDTDMFTKLWRRTQLYYTLGHEEIGSISGHYHLRRDFERHRNA